MRALPIALALTTAVAASAAGAARHGEASLLVGVFEGMLPCADCQGVRAELTLVRQAPYWGDGRYLLRLTYLGRSTAPVVSAGTWGTLRGDALDDDAVVYELDPERRGQHYLKLGENALRLLDADLKPLPANVPSRLRRRSRGLPGSAQVDCIRRGGAPNGARCASAPKR